MDASQGSADTEVSVAHLDVCEKCRKPRRFHGMMESDHPCVHGCKCGQECICKDDANAE